MSRCTTERPKTLSSKAGMDTGPKNISVQRERLRETSTAQKSYWERTCFTSGRACCESTQKWGDRGDLVIPRLGSSRREGQQLCQEGFRAQRRSWVLPQSSPKQVRDCLIAAGKVYSPVREAGVRRKSKASGKGDCQSTSEVYSPEFGVN